MWQCPKCGREFKNTNQDHYCERIETIDEYIAAQPVEVQQLLREVRETIHAAIPETAERISWQMPTFWQGENIVHFAAFRRHIGFFPGGEAVSVFADRLAGYKTSKGTIQFPLSKPIDHALIADIARWRLEQAEGGKSTYAKLTTRERREMPDFIAASLNQSDLWERYRARPSYQQNDYIGWVTRAKRKETRQKRLDQMLDELRSGDAYMGMGYNAKTT
jgi:uncharacterized protein YdhG (YjbR/CyaY superfamily)